MKKKEEWRALVGKYEKSGESRSLFCEKHGVSRGSFDNWVAKFRREKSTSEQSSFVRVYPPEDSPIEVVLTSGITLRVPVSLLKAVLEVL